MLILKNTDMAIGGFRYLTFFSSLPEKMRKCANSAWDKGFPARFLRERCVDNARIMRNSRPDYLFLPIKHSLLPNNSETLILLYSNLVLFLKNNNPIVNHLFISIPIISVSTDVSITCPLDKFFSIDSRDALI